MKIISYKYLFSGVSFWIAVDCSMGGMKSFENELEKKLLAAGLNISSLKAINSRGD